MLTRDFLIAQYVDNGKSMQEIANALGCSLHKVTYYMAKHDIVRRSRSEATYKKHNPNGDPFKLKTIKTLADAQLFGLGLGLYWGEGTKASKHSVRLGNTDPELIKLFMQFLIELFQVKRDDLRFGLQLFSDIDPKLAMDFWTAKLQVERSQFYKIHVTISGSIGTCRRKSSYGVVTLYYHNKKLRDQLVGLLPR